MDLAAFGTIDQFPCVAIQDIYLSCSNMCLRRITDSKDGARASYQLCRSPDPASTLAEPVATSRLSKAEYDTFALMMSGRISNKFRYALPDGALLIYEGAQGCAIFEATFPSRESSRAFRPPTFACHEITDNPCYRDEALAVRDIF